MKNPLLKKAYSPENFRKRGHQLIDRLADHLEANLEDNAEQTIAWNIPENEHEYWQKFLGEGNEEHLLSKIIERTTHVHNPKYLGHQVAPTAPITALTGMISSFLNNGMAVYEMGMSSSAIERIVTGLLCEKMGYDSVSRGFLTSGGTLANLTALLSARKAKVLEDVWNKGHGVQLGIMVSEEAHYCVDRSAKIMGLGEQGIIKVRAQSNFSMDTAQLESKYKEAEAKGIQVFAIVGSAPSTATGSYDDLRAISDFAKKHNLWFHVDGAHGGAAIFSEKYKHTVAGISQADSIVIDGHKMMMMPIITTALLFKDGNHSHATFSQKADYLLEQSEDEDWYNLAKRTFECTKTMMSLHWFTLYKVYGEQIFNEYVTNQFDLGQRFAALIAEAPDLELGVWPQSNIVCFRYLKKNINDEQLNLLNKSIRQHLLEDGEFYIVQTTLRGILYLRTTIMNPFTTEAHLKKLLKKVKGIAKNMETES